MPRHLVLFSILFTLRAAAALPLGQVPPGKTFLVILPHHDDHTWEYTFGGLIAKFADAGYTGYYVRVTNDEKDGALGWAGNNMINLKETVEAVRYLGMKDVISLNWRNDHTDSVPLNEMRAQLILLIRKYRPEAVMAYDPWGHYDRNPDHRKSAKAVAEATWAAGNPNFLPEHLTLGLRPWRVPYRYFAQRSDYGRGYRPNIAFELNESQMERKSKAYWMNRNIRLHPSMARSIRAQLDRQGLTIPELEGLSDEDAAKRLHEWRMYWISAVRGKENGVKYAEVFDFMDEFDDLPALKGPLTGTKVSFPEYPKAALPSPKTVLVVTAHGGDYVLSAGGTVARLAGSGSDVYVIRVANDEKESRDLLPEEAAARSRVENEEAARILGAKAIISLGYRSGELGAVSPTELRDRLLFYFLRYRPDAMFLPNPYTEHDDQLDHLYTGSAAEEASLAAGLANFQPPFALVGLSRHSAPDLYYYSLPLDSGMAEPESTAAFVPQPIGFDITQTFAVKLKAAEALRTANNAFSAELSERLARTGRRLPPKLIELRLRNLGM